MNYKFDNIFIDKELSNHSLLEDFLKDQEKQKVTYLNRKDLKYAISRISYRDGKKAIFFTSSKASFFKKCQGMIEPYRCCNLWTINLVSNCPINCSYCFLQFYLNQKATIIYLNLEEATEQAQKVIVDNPNRLFRVTTGEMSDSLALEPQLRQSTTLIEFFSSLTNATLELKTKTNNINHLLGLKHKGRTIVSWSLNTPELIKREERGSANLQKRLEAAKKIQEDGYLLGFHFDPLVYYPGWQEGYSEVVRAISDNISFNRIAWISLGTLRFAPGMERVMTRYYNNSMLPYGEFTKARDGKMRYLRPIRENLYNYLIDEIKKYGGKDVFLYLCMETNTSWQKIMGFSPDSTDHLDFLFAQSLYLRFPDMLQSQPILEDYVSISAEEYLHV